MTAIGGVAVRPTVGRAVALEGFWPCRLCRFGGLPRLLEAFQPLGNLSMEARSFFQGLEGGVTFLVLYA